MDPKNETWKKEIRKKLILFAHNPEENCENRENRLEKKSTIELN